MKKFSACSAIFLFFLFSSAGSIFADTDVIVYCDDNYPPYSYKEGGEVKGIYTEIMRTAFSRMKGYKIQIKAVPWKRGLKYLETGEGFALYPPYQRIKERPYIWPYSISLLEERVVVFCRDDILEKSGRPKWPEDYYGLTVGNNAGFGLGGDEFWKAVKEGKIRVEEVEGSRKNLLKLGLGRIDCYMNDRISILWELKRLKESEEYDEQKYAKIMEGPAISIENGYLGFTSKKSEKFKFKDGFIIEFNKIIYNMKNNSEIDKIIEKYTK